jgi:hypothetical protein
MPRSKQRGILFLVYIMAHGFLMLRKRTRGNYILCFLPKFYFLNCYRLIFLLFHSNHEKWRSRRRLITPSFHDTQLLHSFMNIFNEQACILARRFDEYVKKPNQKCVIYQYISACTLDIIGGMWNSLSNELL